MKKRFPRSIQSALFVLLLLTACTPAATPSPAPSEDLADRAATVAVIQTQAVAAYFQTLTQAALLAPPASATPFPTRTPADTATITLTPPPLVLPTTAVPTVAINTPAAVTYVPAPAAYQCSIEYQSPGAGQKISIGQDFDLEVIMKNAGTATWNNIEFDFSYVSGAKFQEWEDTFELGQNIGPGGSVSFIVDMIAKTGTGVQQATWALKKGGSPICYIYLDIFVE
ncbi:MAG: hypothetical protein HPY76_01035 [Anaerolineae bacterium]|nr:hypothetical protein [Anaerolineae bacterium]